MQHGALSLCSLLAATSQFSVFIGLHKMQLTGWHNADQHPISIKLSTTLQFSI